jgi:hypothetical protein
MEPFGVIPRAIGNLARQLMNGHISRKLLNLPNPAMSAIPVSPQLKKVYHEI